ncbi:MULTISPECIES: NUDIX hydrolase [unclassified Streptomyces]|uniref:NUDIX hydrolase n=1 Tax=unclassified Streptomyces TaxID=2593676 RepID=UPI0016610AE1|nr:MULTISPECIES: NUDIX hydrolase [unclassified Streptomyces]MBD0712469.1 DNA mismatch repair protein MutT [Streptomyces sp. CBMA291]MBD0716843.1 DNA mismatch repair protein MutT [Streptomyces sp. CBMA370]
MTTPRDREPVRAAGCVLWRPALSGHGIEVALVHRPKYGDWSHPKGKRKRAEPADACALREVLEETGQTCALGPRLPTVRYTVDGRPKEVDYWAARALGGTFAPTREVDALRWLPPSAARTLLTQARDRELLDALTSTPAG